MAEGATKEKKVGLSVEEQITHSQLRKEIRENRYRRTLLTRQARTNEIEDMCDRIYDPTRKNRDLYKFLTQVQGGKTSRFALKTREGDFVESEQQFREVASDFWNKIFQKGNWPQTNRRTSNRRAKKLTKEMKERVTRELQMQELEEAIKALKTDTSSGTTDIPIVFIKEAPESWKIRALEWMNAVWDQEVWPGISKRMDVTLLHKKGPTTHLENYRTLSVGCNLCKLLTRIINNRMEAVVEELDLLTEIQQGFRKGRRAEENLFVLETIIAEKIRTRRSMNVALLDITKAYDRVDRDILWAKLEKTEWPVKLVNVLKSMYDGVYGVISFQGFQSAKLDLTIGLKQGCVLSPLLFALYIAELGERLQDAKTGPKIDGKNIPGLFFADDMLLFGTVRDLTRELEIVANYAMEHKIEFAGHKSMVIPLTDGTANRNKRWKLGNKWLETGEKVTIDMGEESKGTYLGITIHRRCNNFTPFWNEKVRKAAHQVRVIKEATRGMARPLEITKKVYDTYCSPRLLYGCDIAKCARKQVTEIQKAQNDIMRIATRAPQWVNISLLHWITGIWPVEMEIANKKLQLWRYLASLPDSRYAKMALNHQARWVEEDGELVTKNERLTREGKVQGVKKIPWQGFWLRIANGLSEKYAVSEAQLTNKLRIKQQIMEVTTAAMELDLAAPKYAHIRQKGWCSPELEVSTVEPGWLWHRTRWGILEDQYLLRFEFDKISRKVRFQSCTREWIGKKLVKLDDWTTSEYRVQSREVALADTTQQSVEIEEELVVESCDEQEQQLSDIDLNITDSDSDPGEPRTEQDAGPGQEQGNVRMEEDRPETKERVCWMCGKKDSLRHLLWLCPAVSTGNQELRPPVEEETTPEAAIETRSNGWWDWWLRPERTREERQRFGNALAIAFTRRKQWCNMHDINISTLAQMDTLEAQRKDF